MKKHTPRPWKVRFETPFSGGEVYAKGEWICMTSGNATANAHLIAAAPDLLHACKNIVWKLSHNTEHRDGTITPGTIDRNDATVHLCEKAIADAEGR